MLERDTGDQKSDRRSASPVAAARNARPVRATNDSRVVHTLLQHTAKPQTGGAEDLGAAERAARFTIRPDPGRERPAPTCRTVVTRPGANGLVFPKGASSHPLPMPGGFYCQIQTQSKTRDKPLPRLSLPLGTAEDASKYKRHLNRDQADCKAECREIAGRAGNKTAPGGRYAVCGVITAQSGAHLPASRGTVPIFAAGTRQPRRQAHFAAKMDFPFCRYIPPVRGWQAAAGPS